MELVQPAIGLIFWMSLTFLIVMILLKKFAWKPILDMIKERENSIATALSSAEHAKKEMENLKSANDKLLADARVERDKILKEAREVKESIINDAKTKASKEADRITASARENITNEKNAALTELKNQVAVLSVEIAEKILKEQLSSDEKQKSMINSLLKDVNLN